MASTSSQKFIARNRAPRVQIEYDVELYGAEKKVQLPFVMGVMADLAGKPAEPLPAVADRKFLEIDIDNFDSRLKAMKPRVAFNVPNALTGEGNLSLDITFESMDDFSPAAVARKVDALNQLLEARTQLANLLTYMDGKSGAEDLIARLLKDPSLLNSLAAKAKPAVPAKASKPAAKAAPADDDLGGLLGDEPEAPAANDELDDLLGEVGGAEAPAAEHADDDLDNLLGDLGGDEDDPKKKDGGDDDLDSLLADL